MDLPVLFAIALSLGLLLPEAVSGSALGVPIAAGVLAIALARGVWVAR